MKLTYIIKETNIPIFGIAFKKKQLCKNLKKNTENQNLHGLRQWHSTFLEAPVVNLRFLSSFADIWLYVRVWCFARLSCWGWGRVRWDLGIAALTLFSLLPLAPTWPPLFSYSKAATSKTEYSSMLAVKQLRWLLTEMLVTAFCDTTEVKFRHILQPFWSSLHIGMLKCRTTPSRTPRKEFLV